MRRLVGFLERHTAPGQSLNAGLRKRFIDDEVRDALAEGARQVLVVGGGFDTLSLRLAAEHPEVSFVEIDHPATQKPKREALEKLGALRPNLCLASVELSETSLEATLEDLDAWRGDAAGVVVVEAVLMYLEEDDVLRFFDPVRRSTAPGSRLLFTYVQRDATGRFLLGKRSRLVWWSLKAKGEPMLWGLPDGGLAQFLERRGCRPFPAERLDLDRRYLEPAGLAHLTVGEMELMPAPRRSPRSPDSLFENRRGARIGAGPA